MLMLSNKKSISLPITSLKLKLGLRCLIYMYGYKKYNSVSTVKAGWMDRLITRSRFYFKTSFFFKSKRSYTGPSSCMTRMEVEKLIQMRWKTFLENSASKHHILIKYVHAFASIFLANVLK